MIRTVVVIFLALTCLAQDDWFGGLRPDVDSAGDFVQVPAASDAIIVDGGEASPTEALISTDDGDTPRNVEVPTLARGGETAVVGAPVPASSPSSTGTSLGQSVNQLAAAIMARLRQTNGDSNVVFSPLSIAACFSLLYAGAEGETKEELDRVFGFKNGAVANELLQKANSVGAAALANRVYVSPAIDPMADYVDAIGPNSIAQIDFSSPQATQEVNAWVDQMTSGSLGDLIPEGFFSAATRLALVNAIYFQGSWAEPFPTSLTQQGEFRGAAGSKIVDFMMYDSFRRYKSKELPSLSAQMLQFPYDDGQHAMFVILPRADDGWGAVERGVELSPSFFLDDFVNNLEFNVMMPKWAFEMFIDDLDSILVDLGLEGVFSNADLSGIADSGEPLFVSHAIHKAKIKVDEQGTEAAAGTSGAVATSLPPPAEDFHMDHPFLYYIVNLNDGAILFQGTVTDI
ncbi:hypothetical protein BSKO_05004 [Bryopsis sp. KO-2023]|nr:hypothetical protein BSKO_05004 [Bryopsis sp. KO-2023]